MHPKTIRRHLKTLRAECIQGQADPILMRIAYAMETAVRKMTERTVGWPSLVEEAKTEADLLRKELAPKRDEES